MGTQNGNLCFLMTRLIVLSCERILVRFKQCVWSAQLSSTLVLAIWDLRQSCSAANFRNPNPAATQKFLAAVCPRMHSGGKVGFYSGQLCVENIRMDLSSEFEFLVHKIHVDSTKRNVLKWQQDQVPSGSNVIMSILKSVGKSCFFYINKTVNTPFHLFCRKNDILACKCQNS